MEQKSPINTETGEELDVLETQTTQVSNTSSPNTPAPPINQSTSGNKGPKRPFGLGLASRINIYLILFVLLLVVSGGVSIVGYQKSKNSANKKAAVATQPLSQEVLDQLKATDVQVGDPKQILSVESNAVFGGTVLVRGGLEVAGAIKVGGPLTLPGITVSGLSNFDQVQMNSLQVSGNSTIQGQLAVQKGLTVNGSASISGSLSAAALIIDTLQVNKDLLLNRHIDAGGGTPGKSNGSALGSGGTVSVSGTDTAGTVNVNTGGGPGAGCFVTVNFTQKFNATPHVTITPVGSAAADLNYYINRTTTGFSICATNAAPASQSFAFDYIALD
jgi:hypothetical protein